jgi:hypothetical protein
VAARFGGTRSISTGSPTAAVTYGWAGLLLALYAVVALVAGTTLFTRRDVAT